MVKKEIMIGLKILGVLLAALLVIGAVLIGGFHLVMNGLEKALEEGENNWYITEDVSEYGRIVHNGKNDVVEDFVFQFFPEEIEPQFENVSYKYKARDWCDYCCEIYLEFTIADPNAFAEYVEKAASGLTGEVFLLDERYVDYIVSDELPINTNLNYLENACMGRILVCEEEQKIIYTAVLVTACCGTEPENIDFYSRFNVDPLEYASLYNHEKTENN